MWVSSSARGFSSPIASSTVEIEDSGPGSTSAPSTSQQPITSGRPRCFTSITRTRRSLGDWSGEAVVRFERLLQALFHPARGVAELPLGLVVAGPEGDVVARGDQLAQVRRLAHDFAD